MFKKTAALNFQYTLIFFCNKLCFQIFTADIIYHLTDQFTKHLTDQKSKKQDEMKNIAIFPCKMEILPNCIFAKRDPIIIGVKIRGGQLRIGAPICVPEKVRKNIYRKLKKKL